MFELNVKPARRFLKGDLETPQLLPVMVRVGGWNIAGEESPLPVSLAVVIDTSLSMGETVVGGGRKIDKVVEALDTLAGHPALHPGDELILVRFDRDASTLYRGIAGPKTAASVAEAVRGMAENLGSSTQMTQGLRQALEALRSARHAQQKLLVLTDGEAHDAPEVHGAILPELRRRQLALIGYGVGDRYNEDLLLALADGSAGDYYHLERMDDFAAGLAQQLIAAKRETGRNLRMRLEPAPGNCVRSIHRVIPTLAEFPIADGATDLALGHLRDDRDTVFLLGVHTAPRPTGEFRVVTLALQCTLAGGETWRDEALVRVRYTDDAASIKTVEPEVFDYLNQRHLFELLGKARAARTPAEATAFLERANQVAATVGNPLAGGTIEAARRELQREGRIHGETVKRLLSAARTMTRLSRFTPRRGVAGRTRSDLGT
ncbi:MAG: VWA domain-containing protein [Candidatus Competibacteraceae bacterium]|nr:MAG: VWA domain-containing protein [Candidatus Competibacteraceae bacterium]